MRTMIVAALMILVSFSSPAQKTKVPPKKYPSLLWEITGKGLSKPSYLFGTMHVSSKMVFHLSDSFYIGLKNSDVVALETNMGTWQEDFSRYDMGSSSMFGGMGSYGQYASPDDYLTKSRLQFYPYEKLIEVALYSSPSMINNFLYRTYSERSSDFEEDTYLDLHIYQAGKKWGKKVVGVEDFDESMRLMKEAYLDAAKEKNKKRKSYDYDEDFSYNSLEDAYRTGNLDLLDTIHKINSESAAFDEKFLYRRNEIQANSIDSIIKARSSLFVGVGAAHLPGERGVIELLRRKGYKLRPIKMNERDSRHKDEVEKIRVPVSFSKQTSEDGFFSVNVPGKLYEFESRGGYLGQQQFADMSNGSYYMITRIITNSSVWGHSPDMVLRKIDSVVYESIPGKILTKQSITKNGYRGLDIVNRTRRGDYQRYNIFVTPFEIMVFKMSGNGDYVKEGKEADEFFSSISIKEPRQAWQAWSPELAGFKVELPHVPATLKGMNTQYSAYDKETNTAFDIIRTEIHNYDFVEEDSFDLGLMDESFGSSEFVDKQLSRKQSRIKGYAALDAKYKYKDGSIAAVRYLVQGTHYYTLIAHAKSENAQMTRFINSFIITPFEYPAATLRTDTSLYFTVESPVPLHATQKISMYPSEALMFRQGGNYDEDDSLLENVVSKNYTVVCDSTGEKVYVSFAKSGRYAYDDDSVQVEKDSTVFETYRMLWKYRTRKRYELPNGTRVFEYVLGDPKSSRYVRGKSFVRDGIVHRLETQGDTTSTPSSFITSFFETFAPSDTVKGVNIRESKSRLFFTDFFSADTNLHKKAVKNIYSIKFDSTDLPQLKKAIASLTWKEKKYFDSKIGLLSHLRNFTSKASADYLKEVYSSARDTVEIQYAALSSLVNQQTAYAYQVFRDIMISDPPVLGISTSSGSYGYSTRISTTYRYGANDEYSDEEYEGDDGDDYEYPTYNSSGTPFMQALDDSLELTATIIKDILPLMNLDDYERPMMSLVGKLVDSNLVSGNDYLSYQSKLFLEAKQSLKKQLIREKAKSIEEAQSKEKEEDRYAPREQDNGNQQLSLYATLLMPFWETNPAVPQLMNQLLQSNAKRLKYNTVLLYLRNKKPVPDTMFHYFAGLDDYRYRLYTDLKKLKKLDQFPAKENNHISLAKSELLSSGGSYNQPDTIVYLDRFQITQSDRTGYVYFFKYKLKKEDNSWKIASVGLVPLDAKQYMFEKKKSYYQNRQYDFTVKGQDRLEADVPVKEQLIKILRKRQFAKRNSAAEFYNERNDVGIMPGRD